MSRNWTILKPTEMKSLGGATLTLLDDGSILAGGYAPFTDVCTIKTNAGLPKIQAFLLEAIPHETLPLGSSGRRTDGDSLTVSLFQNFGGSHLIGRFRISVTEAPVAILRTAVSALTDSHAKLAAAYFLTGDSEHAALLLQKSPEQASILIETWRNSGAAVDEILDFLRIQVLRTAIDDPQKRDYRNWYLACTALYQYREGKFDEAIAWTRQNPEPAWQTGALVLVVRAMAEHRLGQHEQAGQTLAQAEALIPRELHTLGTPDDTTLLPIPANHIAADWLAPELLRREASLLIRGSTDPQ